MAIKLGVETASGVAANYWRITHLSISPLLGTVIIGLQLYVSEEARRSGKDAVQVGLSVDVPYSSFAAMGGPALESAYECIKNSPQFSGAQDA